MPTLSAAERIGTTLGGRYVLKRLIGEGGFSSVFEALHTFTGREVALKLLHPHLTTTEQITERFLMEARSMARIKHDGIVQVLDGDKDPDGSVFIALELLDGESLEHTLYRVGKLTWGEAVAICVDVLGALAEAHRHKIIHRDIKPGNIFIVRKPDGSSQAKLLDFGIAHVAQNKNKLTAIGMILGTPEYMSPEQGRTANVGPESDLWSVGIVMWECLTGQTPFVADSATEILLRIATSEAPPIRDRVPELPAAVAAVIDRSLTRDIAARFHSADEMREAMLRAVRKADEVAKSALRGNTPAQKTRPPSTSMRGAEASSQTEVVSRTPIASTNADAARGPSDRYPGPRGPVASGGAFAKSPAPPRDAPREPSISSAGTGSTSAGSRALESSPPSLAQSALRSSPMVPLASAEELAPRTSAEPRGRETTPSSRSGEGPIQSLSIAGVPVSGKPLNVREVSARSGAERDPRSTQVRPAAPPLARPTQTTDPRSDATPSAPLETPTSGMKEGSTTGPRSTAVPDLSSSLRPSSTNPSPNPRSPIPTPPATAGSSTRGSELDYSEAESRTYSGRSKIFQRPPERKTVGLELIIGVVVAVSLIAAGVTLVLRSQGDEVPPSHHPPSTLNPVVRTPENTGEPRATLIEFVSLNEVVPPREFTGADNLAEFARHAAVSSHAGITQRMIATCIPDPAEGATLFLHPMTPGALRPSPKGIVACAGYDIGVLPDLTSDGSDDVIAVAAARDQVVLIDSRTMHSYRTIDIPGVQGVAAGTHVMLHGEPVVVLFGEPNGPSGPTELVAISALSSRVIWRVRLNGELTRVGHPIELGLAVGPDADGDGIGDVAAGIGPSVSARTGPNDRRCVQLFGGADGRPLWAQPFCRSHLRGAQSVAVGADTNNDGRADVAVGTDQPNGDDAAVVILSGADGSVLRQINAPNGATAFGWPVTMSGDLTGSAAPEVLVGSAGVSAKIHVYNATTGARIAQLPAEAAVTGNLRVFAVPALVRGTPGSVVVANPADGVHVYSRRDQEEPL